MKILDSFQIEQEAINIIKGRKSQIDVTIEIELKVNQNILRYKNTADTIKKGILNMENLCM